MRSNFIVEWFLTIQHLFKNSPQRGNFNRGVEALGWRCCERIEQHRANAVFFSEFIIYSLVLVLFLFSSCLYAFFKVKKNRLLCPEIAPDRCINKKMKKELYRMVKELYRMIKELYRMVKELYRIGKKSCIGWGKREITLQLNIKLVKWSNKKGCCNTPYNKFKLYGDYNL